MKYLLGIDLGTTAIKVALFDEKLHRVAAYTKEHRLITRGKFAVEQEVEVYWECFRVALEQVLHKADVPQNQITALSVSAQGETMVFLDDEGKPLYPAIVWMDGRAQEEAKYLQGRFEADELHRVTGQTDVIPLSPGCKVLWFSRNHPDLFARTKKILLLEDWFFYRLCGKFYGEGSLWCSTHMWDINTKKYWKPMLEELNVQESQLPQIVESGTSLGYPDPQIAQQLGLSPQTLLVMGGLDQSCGAIGVGNTQPGIFSESTGAAMVVCTMCDKPVIDPNRKLSCFYTAIPDMYMIHGFSSGGIAYKWLRDALCGEEITIGERTGMGAYALMDLEAREIPPGSDGLVVLPHFNGAGPPDTDPFAKCAVYGLGMEHTKAHLIRAYLEGVAMSLCRIVDAVEKMGVPVEEIRALSGGAKSPLWCQIKADCLDLPVVTMRNTEDAACLGAALLAGVGLGMWPSVHEMAQRIQSEERRYLPSAENRREYERLEKRYRLLTAQIQQISEALSM